MVWNKDGEQGKYQGGLAELVQSAGPPSREFRCYDVLPRKLL